MNKRPIVSCFVFCFLLSFSYQISTAADLTLNNTPIQVYFSPHGNCTKIIIHCVDKAKSDILVQAYSFTSASISKALSNAYKRGLKVEVILDKSQYREKSSSAAFLSTSGVPIYIDDRHAIANNKIMIIDQETVITGSFNFTKAAEENNAENLLIIRNKELAGIYIQNWEKHREHSKKYSSPVR